MPRPIVPARARLLLLTVLAIALAMAVYATRLAPAPAPTISAMSPPTAEASAPLPAYIPSPPSPPPVVTVAPPSSAMQRGSIPGLSVNATFATPTGGGVILVSRADGTRGLTAVGSEVAPGITLAAVTVDRATFATGGTSFWLPLQSEAMAKADPTPATAIAVATPAPPAPAPPSEAQRRESQLYQAALAPGGDGPYRGYAVRAQTPLFAKAGLKPGDVITGINGRAFDTPAEIATLSREAALSETLVFTIRRDGRSQEFRVTPK
jgi:general secretion pathway protein C